MVKLDPQVQPNMAWGVRHIDMSDNHQGLSSIS